jgi:uncharacterized protein YjbJ (UPF0337 family)
MRASRLLLAGIGVGAALTYALFYESTLQQEAEFDGVEDSANKMRGWGTRQRFGGGVDTLVGRMKEGVGRIAGDDDLADEGVGDQVVGAAKDTVGRWSQAAGRSVQDLGR